MKPEVQHIQRSIVTRGIAGDRECSHPNNPFRPCPHFDHDGVNFYYELQREGIPLIFSHGLGGDLSQIRELLEGLPGIGLVLYAPQPQ